VAPLTTAPITTLAFAKRPYDGTALRHSVLSLREALQVQPGEQSPGATNARIRQP
jgi:hypothetical protein